MSKESTEQGEKKEEKRIVDRVSRDKLKNCLREDKVKM